MSCDSDLTQGLERVIASVLNKPKIYNVYAIKRLSLRTMNKISVFLFNANLSS